MHHAVILDPRDTVATAIVPVLQDTEAVCVRTTHTVVIRVQEFIPLGHKVAVKMHQSGDLIYKYGFPIGQATQDIPVGSWVHVHNLKGLRAQGRRENVQAED